MFTQPYDTGYVESGLDRSPRNLSQRIRPFASSSDDRSLHLHTNLQSNTGIAAAADAAALTVNSTIVTHLTMTVKPTSKKHAGRNPDTTPILDLPLPNRNTISRSGIVEIVSGLDC